MMMTRFSASNPPPNTALNSDAMSQLLASIISRLDEVVDGLTRFLEYQSYQQLVILHSSASPNPQFMAENPSYPSQTCNSITQTMTPIAPATLITIAIPNKNNSHLQNQVPQQTSLCFPKTQMSNYNQQLPRGPSNTSIRPWGVQKQLEYDKGHDICYAERFGFGLTCNSSTFYLLKFTEEPGEPRFVSKEVEPKASYVGAVT